MAKPQENLNTNVLKQWLFDIDEKSFFKKIKSQINFSEEIPLITEALVIAFNALSSSKKLKIQKRIDFLLKKNSKLAFHSNLVILADLKRQESILRPNFFKHLLYSGNAFLSDNDLTLMLKVNSQSLDILLKPRRKFLGLFSYGLNYSEHFSANFCLDIVNEIPMLYLKLQLMLNVLLPNVAKSFSNLKNNQTSTPKESVVDNKDDIPSFPRPEVLPELGDKGVGSKSLGSNILKSNSRPAKPNKSRKELGSPSRPAKPNKSRKELGSPSKPAKPNNSRNVLESPSRIATSKQKKTDSLINLDEGKGISTIAIPGL